MRWLLAAVLAAPLCAASVATPAHAASPVPVLFGTSWDGPTHELQGIVDAYLGSPGLVNVHTDFIGAKSGDLDPWFWVGNHVPALMITEVAGNADHNVLGWYLETGAKPVIDGIDDGVVFDGWQTTGASGIITLSNNPNAQVKFGFYLDTSGQNPRLNMPTFYTNRLFNQLPPTHAPFDGNVQALVFDVSKWKGANTWLVCFEDRDSGLPVSPSYSPTTNDNDYQDMVFQISALGATPTSTLTFGQLKARYR